MKDNLKKKLQQQDSKHLLLKHLKESLTEEAHIENGTVYLPEYQLHIRPELNDIQHGNGITFAVVYYHAQCPDFEEPFFECVMAGGATLSDALQQAVSGFILSAMCGIRHFLRREPEYELTTSFAGGQHEWDVCKSCMALMGNEPEIDQDGYWEVIREGLAARMGNHRANYIKVYAAKQANGTVTGECRINDIASPELGALVAEKAAQWQLQGNFHSQKQFFWLRQREPFAPYPYTREQVRDFTEQAVRLFEAFSSEQYEDYVELLAEKIGDRDLAVELHAFLPEMCAEYYYEEKGLPATEKILFARRGGEPEPVYKNSITPYYWIRQRLLDGLFSGEFSVDIYRNYIGVSALHHSAGSALENNEDLSKCSFMSIQFVPEDYQVR